MDRNGRQVKGPGVHDVERKKPAMEIATRQARQSLVYQWLYEEKDELYLTKIYGVGVKQLRRDLKRGLREKLHPELPPANQGRVIEMPQRIDAVARVEKKAA